MAKKSERKKPQSSAQDGESTAHEDRLTLLADDLANRLATDTPFSRIGKLRAGGTPKMAQSSWKKQPRSRSTPFRATAPRWSMKRRTCCSTLPFCWPRSAFHHRMWAEMDRRRSLFGIAEKLPKVSNDANDS